VTPGLYFNPAQTLPLRGVAPARWPLRLAMLRLTSRTFRAFASSAVIICVAAPLAQASTVTGRVFDSTTSQPLTGVEVLIDGKASGLTTDANGQFKAEVEGGDRLFTFKRTGFSDSSVGPVAVPAEGEIAAPDAKLYPAIADDIVMLDTLTVEGELVKNSVVADRQQAAISVDLISSADFGKFTGSDVADIAVRIPGISTTSQGSFAVVRGLAERYNPVMLDGIVLPSSDPERQSPELDIFPSRLVDAIVISKTYEPRLPGTSSGAAIDLRTKPLPEGRFTQIQVGIRTDDDYLSNEAFLGSDTGGNWDLLGFGTKERRREAPKNDGERLAYTSTAANGTRYENFPLGTRVSVTYEDRIDFNTDKGQALGFGFSFGRDSTASTESGIRLDIPNIAGAPAFKSQRVQDIIGFSSKEYVESELETRLGLLGTVGYAFNTNHQIGISFFWSQIGTDAHEREFNGIDATGGTYANLNAARAVLASNPAAIDFGALNIENSFGLKGSDEIYYRQRSLYDAQVKGDHKFESANPVEVSWALAKVNSRQDEPDFLSFPYQYSPDLTNFRANFGGGEARYSRYWRDTEEDSTAARVDSKMDIDLGPFETSEVRLGYYIDRTDRAYNENAYLLSSGAIIAPTLNQLFTNVGGYSGSFLVPGGSVPTFAVGERTIDALYGSLLLPLIKEKSYIYRLDLLVGARLEAFNMESTGRGAIGNLGSSDFYQSLDLSQGGSGAGFFSGQTFTGGIDEDKILPAVGINYKPTKPLTLRLAYSQTTARPSFREIGSYFTIDQITDDNIHGNKDLITSVVNNYDLRLEYFVPDSTDLVAVSFFRKDVTQPIEKVNLDVAAAGSVSTWINNQNDAEILGLEFEAAKSLAFLGGFGEYFTLGGNYTYLEATVQRDQNFESAQIASTGVPDERRLFDQPDYILNLYVTCDYRPWGLSTTLSYFAIGDVLQKVNRSSWDTYVAANDRFDLTLTKKFGKQFSLRASARNLLDPERRFIADPESTAQTVVLRSYRDGRSYTLSGIYEF
jgi:outer membrane receptor protein involved in Fe transport